MNQVTTKVTGDDQAKLVPALGAAPWPPVAITLIPRVPGAAHAAFRTAWRGGPQHARQAVQGAELPRERQRCPAPAAGSVPHAAPPRCARGHACAGARARRRQLGARGHQPHHPALARRCAHGLPIQVALAAGALSRVPGVRGGRARPPAGQARACRRGLRHRTDAWRGRMRTLRGSNRASTEGVN